MKFDFSIEINDALVTQTVSAAERTLKAYFAVKAESLKQSGEIQQSQVAQDGFALLSDLIKPLIQNAAVKVQQTEGSNSLLPLLLSFIMPKPQPKPRHRRTIPKQKHNLSINFFIVLFIWRGAVEKQTLTIVPFLKTKIKAL